MTATRQSPDEAAQKDAEQKGAPLRKHPNGLPRVAVIGAGIGGLAAALRLAAGGCQVRVFERAAAPGGKMRALPSAAGPAAAGPTVTTMRHVFDDLFAAAGERLEEHVTLSREEILARHWWPDGSQLDLYSDPAQNRAAISAFAGPAEAARFERFARRAAALFEAFEDPVIRAPAPNPLRVALAALRAGPRLLPALAPWRSLQGLLAAELKDPRLRQLFGRYATYVGGAPGEAPGVLGLIWEAERRGVWRIEGGFAALAAAIESLARARGASFSYGAEVAEILTADGRAAGLRLSCGARVEADAVLFNGDPAALQSGLFGAAARRSVRPWAAAPRSLSAYVWSFAARPEGADLVHHNVFFGADPALEFGPIARGAPPADPTLYLCAQDRGQGFGEGPGSAAGLERFEIIMNAPPLPPQGAGDSQEDRERCRDLTFQSLARMGLRFQPEPSGSAATLTTPSGFQSLFPGSRGSLYGRSPRGAMASFLRPTARSRLQGLYLAGGGVHPGPGASMAALSGGHAAEAIASDRISPSPRRRTVTRGGILTGYPRIRAERSR